jgi:hypothetical protein
MDRATKRLCIQLALAALMAGFALGHIAARQQTKPIRDDFDRCIAITEECIGYLRECRAGGTK